MAARSAPVLVRSSLFTLGKFELWIDDRLVAAPPTHKARALIALTVSCAGRDVARERLLELFWNEFEPERAREGLRTALSSIRHVLRTAGREPDAFLLADKSVVRWLGNTALDAARFEELAHGSAPEEKRSALGVYGGDFLEGIYEEWVVRERDRLAGVYESVLADLATLTKDLDAARLLLNRNPFHEDAYTMLIDAELQANRHGAAAELIAQYWDATREMNAAPSEAFQERFAQVQDVSTLRGAVRRLEEATTIRNAGAVGQTNLPVSLTSFVGRDDDLAELTKLLSESRLVTLAGSGGIGKTRLAIQAAGNLRAAFRDGVWFVDLATVSDPAYVVSAVAGVLSVSEASLDRALQERLIVSIQSRHMLLVLDNCEHLTAAIGPFVIALLRNCADLRILCTSREPLMTEGEQVIRLPALSQADAVVLFVERARGADKQFALSDRNAPIVEAICGRLDGIPLAIELAAPRVSVLSLKSLKEKLDEHFRILTSAEPSRLSRHKTVRALIDWSYDLLSAQEQTLLRSVSVFVGGFTLEAAAALLDETLASDDALDVLSSLVAKSLVLVEADPEYERYSLLQTTQQYAHEKLSESGELQQARERHARYFLELVHRADEEYGAQNAREWLRRYRSEIDNVRAAIEYSFGSADVLSTAALVAAARELWQELGLYAEGLHRAQHAIESLDEGAPLALRASLWLAIAQLSNALHTTPEALESVHRAVDAFESLSDDRHLAFALQSLGFFLIRRGDHDEAEAALVRAQSLAERLGNRRVIVRVLLRRGHNAHASGALERALPIYERCLELARALEDDLFVGYVTGYMANVYFNLGDIERAVSYGSTARDIFRQRKDAAKESNALANLAEYHVALGELEEAKKTARTAIKRALESESTVNAVNAAQHLAAVAAVEGHTRTAARLLGFVESALARFASGREYGGVYTHDRAMQVLQQNLPDAQVQALLREGASLSDEEAFTLAIR